MAGNYLRRLFGQHARNLQEDAGSSEHYARLVNSAPGEIDALTPREIEFIEARDSFYMASVTEEGWPYIQHRGGPPGFVKFLGENRIAFAEYSGNRQFISMGNIIENGRVALFFMDYPARRRLKMIGCAEIVSVGDFDAELSDAKQASARGIAISIIGYDWNCPKYITPRFTLEEISSSGFSPFKQQVQDHEN